MNHRDRKLVGLLLILLPVLGLTFWMGRGLYQRPSLSPGSGGEQTAAETSLPDALSSVEIPEFLSQIEANEDGVERNPFSYASRPTAPVAVAPQPARQPVVEVSRPAPPPPPPTIPFRYSGYGSTDPWSGDIKAVLFDSDNKPYPVSEREILMGRYRINRISEAFVDIEDLELDRRERLPLEIE